LHLLENIKTAYEDAAQLVNSDASDSYHRQVPNDAAFSPRVKPHRVSPDGGINCKTSYDANCGVM
jgi:hypothetical protein